MWKRAALLLGLAISHPLSAQPREEVLVFAATSLTAFAQEWKKDRPVSGITGVSVNSGIDLYLTQGASDKLTLNGRS